jgi:hypothetical protein
MHRRKVTDLEKPQSAFMGYSQHVCKWQANLTFIDNYKGSMNFHITINLLSKTKLQKLCDKEKKREFVYFQNYGLGNYVMEGQRSFVYDMTIFKLSLA